MMVREAREGENGECSLSIAEILRKKKKKIWKRVKEVRKRESLRL